MSRIYNSTSKPAVNTLNVNSPSSSPQPQSQSTVHPHNLTKLYVYNGSTANNGNSKENSASSLASSSSSSSSPASHSPTYTIINKTNGILMQTLCEEGFSTDVNLRFCYLVSFARLVISVCFKSEFLCEFIGI